jgi:hypothetical protein
LIFDFQSIRSAAIFMKYTFIFESLFQNNLFLDVKASSRKEDELIDLFNILFQKSFILQLHKTLIKRMKKKISKIVLKIDQ